MTAATTSSRFDFLFRPVHAHGLGLFRICFGLLMLWELIYFFRIEFIDVFLLDPLTQFTYAGLGWLKPLPRPLLVALLCLLLLATVLITLGRFYRPAMAVFALGFSYLFFLDKAYYNNHLYLICLVSVWMIFIRADYALVWGKKGSLKQAPQVPAWMYYVLQAQLVIVYFYGGLAKLNPDWLLAQQPPIAIIEQSSFLALLLGKDLAVALITYGGVLFDLFIGFFLLYKRTRLLGVIGVLVFNLLNANVFSDINIFPYFMIAATVLFLDQDRVRTFLLSILKKRDVGKKKKKGATLPAYMAPAPAVQRRLVYILGAYFLLQLLIPFRHLLIPGPVDWTGEGQRFSWHMKIQYREMEEFRFEVWDFQSRVKHEVNLDNYRINRDQRTGMWTHPEMAWQFAQFLGPYEQRRSRLGQQIEVHAFIKVRYNGRPAQYVVDPEVNLLSVPYHPWRHNDWIVPLQE